MEMNATVSVGDAAVGSARTTFSGPWIELGSSTTPASPAAGFARMFLDSTTGELSVRKPSGTVISLESGGGGVWNHPAGGCKDCR
jgi:hypothetical protein